MGSRKSRKLQANVCNNSGETVDEELDELHKLGFKKIRKPKEYQESYPSLEPLVIA